MLLGEVTLLESVSAALELDIPAVHIDGRVISVEASFGTAAVDSAPDTDRLYLREATWDPGACLGRNCVGPRRDRIALWWLQRIDSN